MRTLMRKLHSQSTLPPPVSRFESLTPGSKRLATAVAGFLGGSAFIYYLINPKKLHLSQVKGVLGFQEADKAIEKRKLTSREKRFIKFSSVEYQGQVYMTPQDFLESVVEAEPKPRLKRRKLGTKDIEAIKFSTPDIRKNSDNFFRSLSNRGILSYSEYLFLLTILIKPTSGFKIAFSMLDHDGNERIDKEEFRTLESIFSSAARERSGDSDDGEDKGKFIDNDYGLQRGHEVDTSLLVHFFGKHGDKELRFNDFFVFMDNIQTEVLHMEFGEFSKGAPTISEMDFARILLRYTFLNSEEYDAILERLYDRLQEEKGITFQEFKDFCQFLNNLDDFQIAMRMYTLADKPISQEEFSRAVHICTGKQLSPHIVATGALFKLVIDKILSRKLIVK